MGSVLAFLVLVSGELSLGVFGGTTGVGPFLALPLSDVSSMRMGAGFLSLNREQKVDTLTYDLDVSLKWFPVVLDWNPGGSLFRITGGFLINGSSADANYEPEYSVQVGGHTYTPSNLGEVTGDVSMQPVSPYLGIGLGKTLMSTGTGFVLDAGVSFTSFSVSLDHQGGNLSPSLEEQLQEDLDMEADSLEEALNELSVYPVISAGIVFAL